MKSKNGSIILIALFFAAVGGLLVASYLANIAQEKGRSKEDFYRYSAMQLGSAGVEKAILAMNREDWTGWTLDGEEATYSIENVKLGNAATGGATIRLTDIMGMTPIVYSDGFVQVHNGEAYIERVNARLRNRSVFGNGITAVDEILFKNLGSTKFDSYASNMGSYDDFLNRADRCMVAAERFTAKYKTNSEIYGYLASSLGGDKWLEDEDPWTSLSMLMSALIGPEGRIYGSDTSDGRPIDKKRIIGDFEAQFEPVRPPETEKTLTVGKFNLIELGQEILEEKYFVSPDLVIKKNQTLRIMGKVSLVVDRHFTLYGSLEIAEPYGDLKLYIGGSMRVINGPGIINEGEDPSKLSIFQTGRDSMGASIQLGGDNPIHASIFAPEADVYLYGTRRNVSYFGKNNSMFGAIVAENVSFYGDYYFHYDENLKNHSGERRSYEVEEWLNVKPSDLGEGDYQIGKLKSGEKVNNGKGQEKKSEGEKQNPSQDAPGQQKDKKKDI